MSEIIFFIVAVIFFAVGAANWFIAPSLEALQFIGQSIVTPVISIGSWLLTAAFGALGARELWKKRTDGKLRLSMPDDVPQGFLPEAFEKAMDDFNVIQTELPNIKDEEIKKQLTSLQHTSRNMLTYLEKHPEKLPLARRFIDYYQDRTVDLVRKYHDFEATGLDTPDVRAAIDRIRGGLASFRYAYDDQFSKLLSDQIVDLDAELKVAEQMMNSDGIEKTEREGLPDYSAAVGQKEGLYYSETPRRPKVEVEHHEAPRPVTAQSHFTFGAWLDYWKDKAVATLYHFLPTTGREPYPVMGTLPPYVVSDVRRQKMISALLAMFFGSFGAHKFYHGQTGLGLLYAALCWTSLPGWIGFIEGIRYLAMPLDDYYVQYYDKK